MQLFGESSQVICCGLFEANRLRYIWEALSNNKYSHEELQTLLALQSRAVLCCHRAWQVVRHVLCDDSPEGHLPEELEEVEGLDTKDLLSYSFRAIHESRYAVTEVNLC